MLSQAKGRQAVRDLLGAACIKTGDALLVHSAFRALGQQGLRAEWFIEEAIAALGGGGMLLMPAMSWRIVTQLNPLFDVRITAGNVGLLPEIFRKQYAQSRSVHPTHSVAGWGSCVRDILEGHHALATPCPMSSGFGQIARCSGKILLLGVGLECCTTIHCAEEAVAPDIYLEPIESAELYYCRGWKNEWHDVYVRRHRKLPRDFSKFEPFLQASGKIIKGEILGVSWISLDAQGLLGIVSDLLKEEPMATIQGIPLIKENA